MSQEFDLTEVESLKIENLQLKKEKIKPMVDLLAEVEKQILSELNDRLKINAEDYTIDLKNRKLIKNKQKDNVK